MKLFLTLITFSLCLASCNPASLLISQATQAVGAISPAGTCTEALRTLTFPAPCLSGDSAKYAVALEFVRKNRHTEALPIFAELLTTSQDTGLRSSARTILASFAIYDERWQDYVRLYANDARTLNNATGKLVQGWALGRPMTLDFSADEVSIPFTRNGAGSPMIEIIINGKKRTFLFDTGAQKTAISPELASELGIKPHSVSSGGQITGSTGQQVTSEAATIDSISFGGISSKIITAKNVAALVADLTVVRVIGIPIVRFDGIIGWNIAKELDCTLDYTKNIITFSKPQQLTNAGIPNFFPFMNYPLVQMTTTENKQVLFDFDSGAGRTSFAENMLSKFPSTTEFFTANGTTFGVGGSTTGTRSIAKSFTVVLGNQQIQFTNLRSMKNEESAIFQTEGRLGIDICENKRVRIDATNGIFRYE